MSGLVIGRQGGHECYLNHVEKGGSLQEAIPWNTKAEWMCVRGGGGIVCVCGEHRAKINFNMVTNSLCHSLW